MAQLGCVGRLGVMGGGGLEGGTTRRGVEEVGVEGG